MGEDMARSVGPHPEAKTIDELANHCFGCGAENPQGLKLDFEVKEDDGVITATSLLTLTRVHEGPPGHIHGGIIATLLDEAMSKLNRPLGLLAVTRHMEVEYLRPVPLGVAITVTGRHLKRDGRKLFHTAEIAGPGGKPLARAQGVFIVVDPALLAGKAATEKEA
jgi:uncharacterized protein (TIGR00369 family)